MFVGNAIRFCLAISLFGINVVAVQPHCLVPLDRGNDTCLSYALPGPDSLLSAQIWTNAGNLGYALYRSDQHIIANSSLGLVRSDIDLSNNFNSLTCHNLPDLTGEYELLQGKQREIRYLYRQYSCNVLHESGHTLMLQLAMSRDSFAFRYNMPQDASVSSRSLLNENTTFGIIQSPGDFQIAQPYDGPTPKYQTFYQPRNTRERASIGATSGAGESETGFAYAALFKTNIANSSHWILLKEAGFDGTYPASHIRNISSEGFVSLAFPADDDGNGAFGTGQPHSTLPWQTPWRIITIGTSPQNIINDTSVTDLSEPSLIEDRSWITPGVGSWSWWANGSNALNYTETQTYIDLAHRQGWSYSVLDAMWDQQVDGQGKSIDLAQLAAYAASKDVKLWLWMNSAGPNNDAFQNSPRDLLFDAHARRATFSRISQAGIVGVKVDGIQSDKQGMMSYLLDILHDAADFHLMVVFHNCPLPHGWERTWPNLLSSEGLIASEYYTNAKIAYSPQMPENNVNEAFVRYTIGPAEYSPGVFSTDQHPTDSTHTTYAHEVALSIIIDSGLRVLPDTPTAYEHLIPLEITQLLGSLPFVWDETNFIQGDPGKFFVVHKRSGCDHFIAGINGETLNIPADTTANSATGLRRNLVVDLAPYNISNANLLTISDIHGSRESKIQHSSLNSTKLEADIEPFGGIVWKITTPSIS